jgi:HK97 family phage major capsid protein
MNSKELREKRAALLKELEPLANKKAAEFTDADRALWTEKHNELEKVDTDLRLVLQQEEVNKRRAALEGKDLSAQDKRDIARYSFRKAILAGLGKIQLDGIEAEMHQEAIREARENGQGVLRGIGVPYMLLSNKHLQRASTGQNITTEADGGYLKQEEPLLYFEALRNKLVLPGMGARLLTGLIGDMPLVEGGSFTASWLAEDAEDTATKAAFDEFVMKPNRLQVTGALSYQLLRQSSLDVENLIEDMLVAAHAEGLQLAAINGSGTPPEPRGILNKVGIGSVAGGSNGLAPAWKHIVDLESEVMIDNADGPSMAYLTNAKVRGKLKQVEKATNTAQFVWVGNEMNGYPALVTNTVPSTLTKGDSTGVCSAIIFGDFSKLFIGQWGGLDIIVDPYSLKKKAEVEVTVISFGDIGILQPEAFAAMKDALTT